MPVNCLSVRQKTNGILTLLNNQERLQQERQNARKLRERLGQSITSSSSSGPSYGASSYGQDYYGSSRSGPAPYSSGYGQEHRQQQRSSNLNKYAVKGSKQQYAQAYEKIQKAKQEMFNEYKRQLQKKQKQKNKGKIDASYYQTKFKGPSKESTVIAPPPPIVIVPQPQIQKPVKPVQKKQVDLLGQLLGDSPTPLATQVKTANTTAFTPFVSTPYVQTKPPVIPVSTVGQTNFLIGTQTQPAQTNFLGFQGFQTTPVQTTPSPPQVPPQPVKKTFQDDLFDLSNLKQEKKRDDQKSMGFDFGNSGMNYGMGGNKGGSNSLWL